MHHLISPPKLAIFDCDGVVVDSELLTLQLMREDLASRGLSLSLGELIDFFLGGTVAGVGVQAKTMGADIPDDWAEQFYKKIFTVLGQSVELIPGIEAVLDTLDHHGIPFAIGSNGSHRKIEITLGRCGLAERFTGRTFSREDVANPKPAPDVYLLAARTAGVEPGDCVVIEDSATGARAGVAAGMAVMGFTHDTPAAKFAGITDMLFDDMADLPALFGLNAQ
jgi:HAD superfamily hydrolase (TIGR01509 family)